MHSLKSTGIAVLLLAVSVGLYQFSANDQSSSQNDLATELGISDGSQPELGQQPFGQQPFGQQAFQQPPFQQQPTGNVGHNGGQFNNQNQFNNQTNGQLVSSNGFPNQAYPIGQGSQNRQPVQQNTQQNFQPQLASAPNFDALRNNFSQTASNVTNSATNQVNQQFNNLQNQAAAARDNFNQNLSQVSNQTQNKLNQFNQAVGQTINQVAKPTQKFGNQLASNFQPNVDALQKNVTQSVNDFQQNIPDPSGAKLATKRTIEPGRDEGLIDALQIEMDDATEKVSVDAKSGGDFQIPPIQKSPEISIDKDFGGSDSKPQLEAQSIELTSDAENRLVSEQSPIGMDLNLQNVQQANLDPTATAIDNSKLANIEQAWVMVEKMVDEKKFRGALALLTRYYRNDDLSANQRTKLNDWLDALAGKVIYSSEHHFTTTSYKMKPGETLSDIANRWQVPAQVVYNINRKQIGNEPNIVAGTELKMINGPFHAEVDMSSQTLTLFLKNLYAGRFPVKLGISGNPRPGDYNVVAKSVHGHTWRDADGNDFPPESPENGYGPYWIGMTGSLCIHAVSADEISGHSGCVGLSEKDAKDIFGILANHSKVKVVE